MKQFRLRKTFQISSYSRSSAKYPNKNMFSLNYEIRKIHFICYCKKTVLVFFKRQNRYFITLHINWYNKMNFFNVVKKFLWKNWWTLVSSHPKKFEGPQLNPLRAFHSDGEGQKRGMMVCFKSFTQIFLKP